MNNDIALKILENVNDIKWTLKKQKNDQDELEWLKFRVNYIELKIKEHERRISNLEKIYFQKENS